ncbi:Hypothetical predicted protein [Pelobates cultripes]|uniref:Uncharacterized protein n=1 Tax=Pelobates cultripes TaxID=61616 RepID=A0AAD1SKL9_PELCU|nr:Hypothetical predicted protein [Pelobates cultripes]
MKQPREGLINPKKKGEQTSTHSIRIQLKNQTRDTESRPTVTITKPQLRVPAIGGSNKLRAREKKTIKWLPRVAKVPKRQERSCNWPPRMAKIRQVIVPGKQPKTHECREPAIGYSSETREWRSDRLRWRDRTQKSIRLPCAR